jgi:hypothetical protein
MKRETKKNTFFIFLFEGNFVQGLRTRKSTLLCDQSECGDGGGWDNDDHHVGQSCMKDDKEPLSPPFSISLLKQIGIEDFWKCSQSILRLDTSSLTSNNFHLLYTLNSSGATYFPQHKKCHEDHEVLLTY